MTSRLDEAFKTIEYHFLDWEQTSEEFREVNADIAGVSIQIVFHRQHTHESLEADKKAYLAHCIHIATSQPGVQELISKHFRNEFAKDDILCLKKDPNKKFTIRTYPDGTTLKKTIRMERKRRPTITRKESCTIM